MLGVVEAVGVGKMGVFTAQLLGLGVHGVHKGAHGAGDTLRQDIAGLVGGDHHHAVQQVPDRHGLAYLNVGGAAVGGQALQRGGGGGQFLVHGELSLVDGLQSQQSGHDLGQTGGIQLLMLVFRVDNAAGIGVHQQGGFALDVRLLNGSGGLVRGGEGRHAEAHHQNDQ